MEVTEASAGFSLSDGFSISTFTLFGEASGVGSWASAMSPAQSTSAKRTTKIALFLQ
jgi:hypothetical protein